MNDFLEFILIVAAYLTVWCWWAQRCIDKEDEERARRFEDQARARRLEDKETARRHRDTDYTGISLEDF